MTEASDLYPTRAKYFDAILECVEQLAAEEVPEGGRRIRKAARAIAKRKLNSAIPASLWNDVLNGNAKKQERYAIDFLKVIERALVDVLED
ncbi:hypothetical protein [Roseomonas genomospecies 6]|uniref:hypothetical protein n=1 Tax=Roseomonas genomospecies 6 TaxID=214106 RepID=UPI0011F0B905|nr:hypothetical protein [Roseomonas genomospecies 6]